MTERLRIRRENWNRDDAKFIRRDSELPVDAPLSATDGFIWSRLEAAQTVDDLTRATGLGLEQVHAS